MNALVIGCSSLENEIASVQKKAGTDYPVMLMDQQYCSDPSRLHQKLVEAVALLPGVDVLLIAMGFCGGVWDHVTVPCRTVIPLTSDCAGSLDLAGLLSGKHDDRYLVVESGKTVTLDDFLPAGVRFDCRPHCAVS